MLTFREWKMWIRSKPRVHRWFIYLVLLRPFIDAFYSLKSISSFLSPLYIVAVLTPLLCFRGIVLGPKRIGQCSTDRYFSIWFVLALINMAFMIVLIRNPMQALELVLRFTMPFYLYFFIRSFIQNKTDLIRLLQTFLYGEIFTLLVFLYEVVRGPIRVEQSRGFERYVGLFADNYNYSFFITLVFLVLCWFYLTKKETGLSAKIFWIFIPLELLFLAKVVHIATWSIFAFLVIWYLLSSARINISIFIVLCSGLLIAYLAFGKKIETEYINPATESEIAALTGEKDIARLGHGRMSRWVDMVPKWESATLPGKLLGLPWEFERSYFYMYGGVVHNEFLRTMFVFGIGGLILFIAILFKVFRWGLASNERDRFLIVGSVAVFALYGLSGSSLLYPHLQYITFSIFSYAALPSGLQS
jgi:hypothetical protein